MTSTTTCIEMNLVYAWLRSLSVAELWHLWDQTFELPPAVDGDLVEGLSLFRHQIIHTLSLKKRDGTLTEMEPLYAEFNGG